MTAAGDARSAALLLIGAALGIVLQHSAFGFAGAYRRMFLQRDFAAVRAQLAMLALATALFAPTLASWGGAGGSVVGAVAPLGVQVAVGSFMFGVGMQLGGGCGSGTLFALGGGGVRMALTLAAFCAGGLIGSFHLSFWSRLPGLPPVSIGASLGWGNAAAIQLAVLFALWVALGGALRRNGGGMAISHGASAASRILTGPWSLYVGAAALAGLNWLTLVVAGHPWSITWGFTLWGAKAASALGWEPQSSAFWSAGFPAAALSRGVLEDTTSVMNIGIVAGAMLAASLAGRFGPRGGVSPGPALAALLGGLLMGYGARLSFGCNIGAFFSGVASTSLHGWAWIAFALPGTWLGVRLRPRFGLRN